MRRKVPGNLRRVRVSCKVLESQRKVWMRCKALGNQRTALERKAPVRRRVPEKYRRLARRTAPGRLRTALAKRRGLVRRMGLATRRGLATRKVVAQSRGQVKRKGNTPMVRDNNVGYPGKDLTYTVLQSRMGKAKAHRRPQGRMGPPVVMRLQSSLQGAQLDWARLACYGRSRAPLLQDPG